MMFELYNDIENIPVSIFSYCLFISEIFWLKL